MIQLIAGCMAIHSAISKTKIGIQDVISPYSFDQFFISNAPRTRKCVKKRKKSNYAWIVVSRQFDLSRKSKSEFPFTKNSEFIKELGVAVGSTIWLRSTVEMPRRLIETVWLSRVRSAMKIQDASTSLVWRGGSIWSIRWILIRWSW